MELYPGIAMPSGAPGCFASPTVYSLDSQICKACQAYKECGNASVKALEGLRERVNVTDLLARHAAARKATVENPVRLGEAEKELNERMAKLKVSGAAKVTKPQVVRKDRDPKPKYEIAVDEGSLIKTLPVKVQDEAKKLISTGMLEVIKTSLPNKVSPYSVETKPTSMSVVCKELLKGPVTKRSIMTAGMRTKGWTEGTAASQVNICLGVLKAFGVVQEDGNNFVVIPKV